MTLSPSSSSAPEFHASPPLPRCRPRVCAVRSVLSLPTVGSLTLLARTRFNRFGSCQAQAAFAAPKAASTGLSSAEIRVNLGGFFVTEFEYHQEPDGAYKPLLEINQVRIYFSADINPNARANHVGFLAEWNPVPEEVIHQIDAAAFDVNGQPVTLAQPELEIEGLVPFEQAYVGIQNLAHSGIDLQIGQIRNPFGIWSDYTSHRNFSATKNNLLVNGFALKKIELGLQLSRQLGGGLEATAALVHGRPGRTFPLDRVDHDDTKDVVGRVGWSNGVLEIGASGYFGGGGVTNLATGIDWRVSFGRVLLSGEGVYQRNTNPSRTYQTSLPIDTLASQSAYVQAIVSINPRLSVYGFYELWRLLADGDVVHQTTAKAYQGARFLLHPRVRWTVFELGWNQHGDFDDGHLHLSTQLELQF